jgi:hypothetical protein
MSESDRGYNISKRGAHHPSPMSSTTRNRTIISNSELAPGQGADRPHPLSPWKVNDMCDYTTPEDIRHEHSPRALDDTSRNVSGVDTKTPDVIILDAPEDGEDKFSPDDKWISPGISLGERYEIGYDELALDNPPSRTSRSSVKIPRPINSVQDQGNLDVIKTTIKSFFSTAPDPSSFQAGSLQHPSQGVLDNAALNEKFREQSRELGKLSQVCVNLKEDIDELLCENQLMRVQGADLERQIVNLNHYQERRERELQAEIRKSKAERNSSEEKYEALIRKQQEESFKQMSNGRWLPIEDTKVVSDLGRIKKEMRNWAKSIGVKGAEAFENLSNSELMSLLKNLSHVAVIKNNELPRGLSESKSPALLFNALLAHHLYTTMFRSPFFFLDNGLREDSSLTRGAALLRTIYKLAQDCKTKFSLHARGLMLTLFSQQGRCTCLAKPNSTSFAPYPRNKHHRRRKTSTRPNGENYCRSLPDTGFKFYGRISSTPSRSQQ